MTNLAAINDVVEHVASGSSLREEPGVSGSHGPVEHEACHLEAVRQFRTDETQVVQEGILHICREEKSIIIIQPCKSGQQKRQILTRNGKATWCCMLESASSP